MGEGGNVIETIASIEKKLEKLREDYKTSKLSDRKLIVIRGKLYKRQLESLERKYGRKLI